MAPQPQTVNIEVDGQPVSVRPGLPLLNELLNAGRVVATSCGGKGTCHLCRVYIDGPGGIEPPGEIEHHALGNVLIAEGMRLSCQVVVVPGLIVRLPEVETRAERLARIRSSREAKKRSDS